MDFAEFFEQTAPGLVRLCFLTTLDREAAADAAQEALSRAWRDWPRIGDDSSDPSAWTLKRFGQNSVSWSRDLPFAWSCLAGSRRSLPAAHPGS